MGPFHIKDNLYSLQIGDSSPLNGGRLSSILFIAYYALLINIWTMEIQLAVLFPKKIGMNENLSKYQNFQK